MEGLGALLGASWEPRRAYWDHLGSHRLKERGPQFSSPLRSPQNPFLGPPWGALGAVLGPSWGPLALGALLGASRGHLGSPGGPLGAILEVIDQKRGGSLEWSPPLGPSKPPLGALLEPSWGALGRSWGRLGSLLGPSWGLLGQSWGHLEASEAHRERNGEKAKIINFP